MKRAVALFAALAVLPACAELPKAECTRISDGATFRGNVLRSGSEVFYYTVYDSNGLAI